MTGRWKQKRIGVIMGGESREREISLKTGRAVFAALERQGYDVAAIDAGRDLVDELRRARIDVAFIALHGKWGEDGCVQGLLEWQRLPYTGSGVLASAIGMEKITCKRLAETLGITTPEDKIVPMDKDLPKAEIDDLAFPFPVVVKPSREGSTINVTIVHEPDQLEQALTQAAQSDERVIVERYIQGREVTVGILNGQALPVVEIAPRSGFYDYTAKYTKGMTDYIVPARIDATCAQTIQHWSEWLYSAIDAGGVARADFMIDTAGQAYFLEINTIPGMTELSLVPKAAAHLGIGFDELCERILETACLKVKA